LIVPKPRRKREGIKEERNYVNALKWEKKPCYMEFTDSLSIK
jgi:hypothetical protein